MERSIEHPYAPSFTQHFSYFFYFLYFSYSPYPGTATESMICAASS